MPSLDDLIRTRRSVRAFLPEPVPAATIREVFELAQHTPSNCNVQPWRSFVATGAACDRLRARLVEACRTEQPSDMPIPIDRFTGEYRQRQIECAVELYGKMGVARDDLPGRLEAHVRNYAFFDAPQVAMICMDASFGVGVALDVGMYIHTLMLLFAARGVATCPQAALRAYEDITRDELGIPEGLRVVAGLSFGYEDPSARVNEVRQARQALEQNVRFIE